MGDNQEYEEYLELKKLLLINPTQHHSIGSNLPSYADENRGNVPPLGLLYTAAAIEQKTKGWEVSICDMMVGDTLDNYKPDLVGITTTTFTLLDTLEIARRVKEKWNVPIVLGGIHPTIYPEETVSLPNIDCVFAGESENTFPQYIDAIANGLCKIVKAERVNVQNLPIPARHLLQKEKYYSVLGTNKYSTTMITSRGCPYNCVFCHRETMGRTWRARTAEQVVNEIRQIKNMGINEILIYDDTFTVDIERASRICETLISDNIKVSFDIRTRVDRVSPELLTLLKKAGCKRIHYGVEASSDIILKQLGKTTTISQVNTAFKQTRDACIELLAYFIIGNPSETTDDIQNTISYAKELKANYCHFSIMTPYPATPLYELGLLKGLYNDYWLEFAKNPSIEFKAPYWPELDSSFLEKSLDKAYKEFYLRPTYIAREMVKTHSIKSLGKKAHAAISMMVGG